MALSFLTFSSQISAVEQRKIISVFLGYAYTHRSACVNSSYYIESLPGSYPFVFVDTATRTIFNHQVRDSDSKDPKRERIVHLIDDFRISGANGERILYRQTAHNRPSPTNP